MYIREKKEKKSRKKNKNKMFTLMARKKERVCVLWFTRRISVAVAVAWVWISGLFFLFQYEHVSILAWSKHNNKGYAAEMFLSTLQSRLQEAMESAEVETQKQNVQ